TDLHGERRPVSAIEQFSAHDRPPSRARLAHALNHLGNRLLVRAPAGRHPERRLVEHGLDAADLPVLDLEQLRELPRPIDLMVVEEPEREHDPPLAVDRDEAPIAYPRHDIEQRAVLELLLAREVARDEDAVLVADAVVRERVVALAVVTREPGEVVVRVLDQLLTRRSLRLGNGLAEDRVRLAHRLDVVAGVAERAVAALAAAEELHLRPDRELLDLGDPLVDDLEANRDCDEIAFVVVRIAVLHVLDDGADEGDLLRLDVGHVELIAADARHAVPRSEEHTSELQSRENLVCRLLLEKKKAAT